jgi:hypothetical protein
VTARGKVIARGEVKVSRMTVTDKGYSRGERESRKGDKNRTHV